MKHVIMLLLMVVSAPASAGSLYVNGVLADGLRNTAFQNCDVRIDDEGNVHISAKGFVVQPSGAAKQPGTPGAPGPGQAGTLTRRYYLVGLAERPGESQWVIDVFINNKFVRKITDRERQTMLEVTKYLKVGRNTVHLQASRDLSYGRRSSSPRANVEVVIGEGSRASGALLVNNPIIRYRKTAAEMGTEVKDFPLVAQ